MLNAKGFNHALIEAEARGNCYFEMEDGSALSCKSARALASKIQHFISTTKRLGVEASDKPYLPKALRVAFVPLVDRTGDMIRA